MRQFLKRNALWIGRVCDPAQFYKVQSTIDFVDGRAVILESLGLSDVFAVVNRNAASNVGVVNLNFKVVDHTLKWYEIHFFDSRYIFVPRNEANLV